MRNRIARILALALTGALLTGCAAYVETSDNPYAASPGPPYHPGATIEREEPPQGL